MGTDGIKRVSNSELKAFKTCRRNWWLGHVRKLHRRRSSLVGPAQLGTRVHSALESYYGLEGVKGREAALASLQAQLATELVGSPELADDILKEHELATIMIVGYCDWLEETGSDADLEILEAETIMETESPVDGVHLIGKLDLLAQKRSTGDRLFIDHKAQPLDSKILTPTGWTTMGEIEVGDEVLTPSGRVSAVTGRFPQGTLPVYKLTFSDGAMCESSAEHLWKIGTVGARNLQDSPLTLQQLMERKSKVWVPSVEVLDFEKVHHEIPPYTLGVLIGDGSLRHGVRFSSADPEIAQWVSEELPSPLSLGWDGGIEYHIKCNKRPTWGAKHSWKVELDRLGLKSYSYEKRIPSEYLWGTAQQRIDLLRGLMDTDGSATLKGNARFSTTSEGLALDVCSLIRSLGGLAHQTGPKPAYYHKNGKRVECHPYWGVAVVTPPEINPFRLPRKASRWTPSQKQHRVLRSIEPSRDVETQCIMLDDGDHLYVTDDFIVTHNTVADLKSPIVMLNLDEQSRMYALMRQLLDPQGAPVRGQVWNMLKKVKQTVKAKPPFYLRHEIYINDNELRAFWARLYGEITDLVRVEEQLLAGADHRVVAYPTPTRDCSWRCPFYEVCPMLDDEASDAEYIIESLYEVGDPLQRYGDSFDTPETANVQ